MSDRAAGARGTAVGHPPAADLALLAVAIAAVSTSAPLIREAALPALAVAFWRNALATGVLAPAAVRSLRRSRLTGREAALTAAAGVLLALHFATWIPSLSYTSVASSVALVATQPVWAALMARAAGRRISARGWLGIMVALGGAVAVSGVDFTLSSRAVLGDGLALAGGVLAAAYLTVGSEVRRTVSTVSYTTVCYGCAAAVLLVACALSGQSLSGYPTRSWACLVGLVAGAQLLGHSLFNLVLRTTTPTAVSVAILGEIVGATLLAAWWFGERPPAATVPAAAAIVAGIMLVVRSGAGLAVAGVPG